MTVLRQPFVTNLSAVEMKPTTMEENLALKNFSQYHYTVEFWRHAP